MSGDSKLIWIMLVLVALGVAIFWFYPDIEEELSPEPFRAWIAIEVAGEGVARTGWRKIESGTEFFLHAVLEARGRGDSSVFYTEALGLEIEGEPIPPERLRRWGRRPAKVRWFSIEGGKPILEVESEEELQAFQFHEFYRPDWPLTWSIPGRLESQRGSIARDALVEEQEGFGTQRYHIRVEIYESSDSKIPLERYKSWGPDEVFERGDSFPTVTAYLPGILRPATEVFGLTQIEVEGDEAGDLLEKVLDLSRQRLAFGRVPLMRQMAAAADKEVAELEWRPLELAQRPPWTESRAAGSGTGPAESREDGVVMRGDLLQFFDRVVVLYEDRGEVGTLDLDDLCLDFAGGAAVRPLGQVFDGEGELSWVPLRG